MFLRLRTRMWRAYLLAATLVVALSIGGWAGGLQLTGNIHTIKLNEAYRAAQLNGSSLAGVLQKYGIKTVVNLRGEHLGLWWYDNELAVTAAQNAGHIDIHMGARCEPDAATLQRLRDVLRTAERPVLIHCNSGSDRTGLAAGLFALLVEELPPEIASRQLSFRYGHFPWLGSKIAAMDRTFWGVAMTRSK